MSPYTQRCQPPPSSQKLKPAVLKHSSALDPMCVSPRAGSVTETTTVPMELMRTSKPAVVSAKTQPGRNKVIKQPRQKMKDLYILFPHVPVFNNTCKSSEFMCQNRQCIPKHFVCDHDNDCSDGSDESQECGESSCRWTRSVCSDCRHRIIHTTPLYVAAEYPTCGPNEFRCANGRCLIQSSWECDGETDCHDQSDEAPKNPRCSGPG